MIIKTESEILKILKRVIDGEFDSDLEKISSILDESSGTLEKINLFIKYDDNKNSLLHKATDHLSALLSEEAQKYLS